MVSIKDTFLYDEVQKEFNYSFGNFYIFKKFIVSEINEGVRLTWENKAECFVKDFINFTGVSNFNNYTYISNRLYEYCIVPSDWLKFRKLYKIKSYCIVSKEKVGKLSYLVESLFYPDKIKRFHSTYTALNWVKNELKGVEA